MQRTTLLVLALLLITLVLPTILATDNNSIKSCAEVGEKFSLVYTNEYPSQCCSGLTAWESGFDTREIVNGKCVETGRLAGSPVGTCIKCGDGVCGEKENICNCEKDCSVPQTTITETVKCLFNSFEQQSCTSEKGSCTTNIAAATGGGVVSCAVTIKGEKGEKITWKSSCGGYAYTIIDGVNEYAKFDCNTSSGGESGGEVPGACACTLEYNPVCGEAKVCVSVDYTDQAGTTECYNQKKTFGNKCAANCAKATILYAGECKTDSDNFCGGIAGIPCKEGYECELEGDYPDAVGKCVLSCPEYPQPFCTEGQKLVPAKDARGCPGAKCVDINATKPITPKSEFYKGAYWKCSDGKEYKQYSDKCRPAAGWKEYARKVCANAPVGCEAKCGVNTFGISGDTCTAGDGLTGYTGVKISCYDGTTISLGGESSCKTYATWTEQAKEACANKCNTLPQVTTNTVTTNTTSTSEENTIPATTSTASGGSSATTATAMGPQEIISNYLNGLFGATTAIVEPVKSIENPTTTSKAPIPVQINSACTTQAGYVVDFELFEACRPGEQNNQCYSQTIEEIKAVKEKCSVSGGEVLVILDDKKCNTYSCVNKAQVNNECKKEKDLPAEKKTRCELQGGEFIVKSNESGCLTFVECVGSKSNQDKSGINKEILTDKSTLLGIALKIESIKIELTGIANKLDSLINYYSNTNDANAKDKFSRAKNLLEKASNELDSIKKTIRANIDSFTEADAKAVREKIRGIMEDTIREVLLIMLE
jgi:hypothetical protein